jgi:hypothetical protein
LVKKNILNKTENNRPRSARPPQKYSGIEKTKDLKVLGLGRENKRLLLHEIKSEE